MPRLKFFRKKSGKVDFFPKSRKKISGNFWEIWTTIYSKL